MKKILLSLVLASAAAQAAAVIACTTTPGSSSIYSGTLAALNVTDGYLCGDKLFTSFTGSAPSATIEFTTITPNLYRIEFLPDGGSTTSAFTLNFTVSTTAVNDRITQVTASMFTNSLTGEPLPNTTSATVSGSGGNAPSNALMTGNVNDQDTSISYTPGVTSTTIAFSFTPGANGALQSYEVNVFETAIPEPTSLALLGSGLLGLGFVARRRRK